MVTPELGGLVRCRVYKLFLNLQKVSISLNQVRVGHTSIRVWGIFYIKGGENIKKINLIIATHFQVKETIQCTI